VSINQIFTRLHDCVAEVTMYNIGGRVTVAQWTRRSRGGSTVDAGGRPTRGSGWGGSGGGGGRGGGGGGRGGLSQANCNMMDGYYNCIRESFNSFGAVAEPLRKAAMDSMGMGGEGGGLGALLGLLGGGGRNKKQTSTTNISFHAIPLPRFENLTAAEWREVDLKRACQ
jgi:hypothetical protein